MGAGRGTLAGNAELDLCVYLSHKIIHRDLCLAEGDIKRIFGVTPGASFSVAHRYTC